MLNINPQDVNRLRELLASGQINEADLSGMQIQGGSYNPQGVPLSAQERFAQGDRTGALPMNSMRNESTGQVTYFGQGGGFSDKPYAQAANAQQPRRKVRVVGVGDGNVTELGEEDERALPIDYTRPGINMPGIGRGHYTADGRYAVVDNPDGSRTKVVLGYDADASERRNDMALKREAARANIEQTQAQTEALRAKPQGMAPVFNNDMGAWVLPPSSANPTGKVLTPQGASAGGNMNKATEDEKRSAGLAIRMNNAIAAMGQHPEGSKPQVGPEILRSLPLVGEALANSATGYERQTVEAAQLDALDAALTLATGAAYTKEQLKGLAKSYFPQLGDDDRTIADKQQRLSDVVETARIRAGRAAPMIDGTREEAKQPPGIKQGAQAGIPTQAVEYLRANPLLKDAFDMKYGRGASARVLGGNNGQPLR